MLCYVLHLISDLLYLMLSLLAACVLEFCGIYFTDCNNILMLLIHHAEIYMRFVYIQSDEP